MNYTKLQLQVAVIAALVLLFIDIVPNRNNIWLPFALAILTIRPLLTMNIKYRIVSGILLAYFIVVGVTLYREGVKYEGYQATKPIERILKDYREQKGDHGEAKK